MTCIAAIIKDSRVWMASDSRRTTVKGAVSQDRGTKIWEKKTSDGRNWLIGEAGSVRHLQLCKEVLEWPDLESGLDPLVYIIKSLVPAIVECLSKNGYLGRKDDQFDAKGSLLIATEGKLFQLWNDLGVCDESSRQFASIGSGAAEAFGSLATTQQFGNNSPTERLQIALEVAAQRDGHVSGPFHFLEI